MLGPWRSVRIALVVLSAVIGACSPRGVPDGSAADASVAFDGLPPLDVFLPDTADAALDAGPPPQWTCPPGWVGSQRGGCGPAVILCGDPLGAVVGACDGLDLHHPSRGATADAGITGSPFFLLASDAGIGGPWSAGPGAADGGSGCAAGWTLTAEGTCDGSLRSDCPAGSGALPGGGCTATADTDCPSTDFADPGPESLGATVVHVRRGADASTADGSAAHPYATLSMGVAEAGIGGWVLVAAGSYPETLTLSNDLHVLGVCASRVSLSDAPGGGPLVSVLGGVHAALSGITLSGAGAGMRTAIGAGVTLVRVRVDGASGAGIDLRGTGTTLLAQDLSVTRTVAVEGGDPGTGLWIREGAVATISGLFHAGNPGGVVVTGTGSSLVLTGSTLRDARPRVDTVSSAGLVVANGAQATVSGVVVASNLGQGLVVTDPGSRLDLSDAWVRDTLPLSTAQAGTGVAVANGATMQATRVWVTAARSTGVEVDGAGSVAWLLGSAVEGTLPSVTGAGGTGLLAGTGGVLHAIDVLVARSEEEGVAALPGQVTLSDVLVQGVVPSLRGLGLGLVAAGSGNLTGERVAVLASSGTAIAAADLGSAITRQGGVVQISNVFVQTVNPSVVQVPGATTQNTRAVAYGLFSAFGSTLDLDHAVVEDGGLGVFATGGTLQVVTGVVTGQRRLGAYASQGVQTQPVLTNVYTVGNGDDSLGLDATLPEVTLTQ